MKTKVSRRKRAEINLKFFKVWGWRMEIKVRPEVGSVKRLIKLINPTKTDGENIIPVAGMKKYHH